MDVKLLTVVAVLMVMIYAPPTQATNEVSGSQTSLAYVATSITQLEAKPISLVERCFCRSTVNNLPRSYIRELRLIHTPNCPFQVIAKLKTNKEVCLNPEIQWLKQYLKNAFNKMKKTKPPLRN